MGRNDVKAKIRLEGDATGADRAIKKTEGSFKSLVGSIKSKALAITAALGSVVVAFREIEKSAERLGQRRALEDTLADQGISINNYLKDLNQLADGQIATSRLILSSNRALKLGLEADDIGALLSVAANASVDLGISVTQAFDDITTGIGRASPLILDNLGIVIDATRTYADFADSIGVSTEELTKQQKTMALTKAVIADASSETKQFSERQAELSRIIGKATAALVNFKDTTVGIVTLLPDAVRGVGRLTESIRALTSAQLENTEQSKTDQLIRDSVNKTLTSGVTGIFTLIRALADLERQEASLREEQKKAADAQLDVLNRRADLERATGSLIDLTFGYEQALKGVQISTVDFTQSLENVTAQVEANARAFGLSDDEVKSFLNNFATMTKNLGSASQAYGILIKNMERALRIQKSLTDSAKEFTDEAERLGVVLEKDVNTEIEKNNAFLEETERRYRLGEISLLSYNNAVRTVTEANRGLRESLTGVSEVTGEAIDGFERYRAGAVGATRGVDGLSAANRRLAESIAAAEAAAARSSIGGGLISNQDPLFPGLSGGTFTVPSRVRTDANGRIVSA